LVVANIATLSIRSKLRITQFMSSSPSEQGEGVRLRQDQRTRVFVLHLYGPELLSSTFMREVAAKPAEGVLQQKLVSGIKVFYYYPCYQVQGWIPAFAGMTAFLVFHRET